MSLSSRQKQSLYQSLASLLRTGIPFPGALEKLQVTASGPMLRLMKRLRESVHAGTSVGEAFATQGEDVISPMEWGVIAAVEQSGKLDHGFQQLGGHFQALADARDTIIQKSLYPAFVLHFAILSLALPVLFSQGAGPYLRAIVPPLVLLYVLVGAVLLALPLLRNSGSTNPFVDGLLRKAPLFGKVRRHFANARFCMIYQLELDAGVNVLDSLEAAAQASQSGLIASAVRAALPEVRAGAQVGPVLAKRRVFPETMMRAFIVGEESGGLDAQLQEQAREFQARGLEALDSGARRFGKLIYVAVLVYVGWRIISTYQGIYDAQKKFIEGL